MERYNKDRHEGSEMADVAVHDRGEVVPDRGPVLGEDQRVHAVVTHGRVVARRR